MSELASDYAKYRGRCREMSEAAVTADPTLTLVRGWYDCPFWGKQQHWWTQRPDADGDELEVILEAIRKASSEAERS